MDGVKVYRQTSIARVGRLPWLGIRVGFGLPRPFDYKGESGSGGPQGDRTTAPLASRCGVSTSQVTAWKKKLIGLTAQSHSSYAWTCRSCASFYLLCSG